MAGANGNLNARNAKAVVYLDASGLINLCAEINPSAFILKQNKYRSYLDVIEAMVKVYPQVRIIVLDVIDFEATGVINGDFVDLKLKTRSDLRNYTQNAADHFLSKAKKVIANGNISFPGRIDQIQIIESNYKPFDVLKHSAHSHSVRGFRNTNFLQQRTKFRHDGHGEKAIFADIETRELPENVHILGFDGHIKKWVEQRDASLSPRVNYITPTQFALICLQRLSIQKELQIDAGWINEDMIQRDMSIKSSRKHGDKVMIPTLEQGSATKFKSILSEIMREDSGVQNSAVDRLSASKEGERSR